MDLTHGDLEGVRFGHLFSKQRHLIRCSEISSSQEKVTLVPRMLDSQGSLTIQLLLPLTHVSYRCQVLVLVFAGTAGSRFKKSDPTKKSDIYPMAMTIYEVSFRQYKSGRSIKMVPGTHGRKSVSRVTRGHTGGLWEMTEFRWKQDPNERPTVDRVLDALKSARGCGNHGELCTPSPVND